MLMVGWVGVDCDATFHNLMVILLAKTHVSWHSYGVGGGREGITREPPHSHTEGGVVLV